MDEPSLRVDYFPNGDLKIIYYASRDKGPFDLRQDEYIEFHKNGNLRYHYMFLNDRPHGECKKFNENGELIFHKFFKNGTNVTERVAPYVDDIVMFKLVVDIPVLPAIDVAYLHKKHKLYYD
jgi:hypothetical protein